MSYDKEGLGVMELSLVSFYFPNTNKRVDKYLIEGKFDRAVALARLAIDLWNKQHNFKMEE